MTASKYSYGRTAGQRSDDGVPSKPGIGRGCANEDHLIDELVELILGWRLAPGRYIKPSRGWMPRWRFNPLARMEDAFLLLDRAGGTYLLSLGPDGLFTVEVRIGNRIGNASGEPKARAITLALSEAFGIGESDRDSD